LADRLDEASEQLGVELATKKEVDAELEALRTSATRVLDLVLGNADGSSSLVTSRSIVVELLKGITHPSFCCPHPSRWCGRGGGLRH
jgi:hypothetical protein